jgi:hypothetical protein
MQICYVPVSVHHTEVAEFSDLQRSVQDGVELKELKTFFFIFECLFHRRQHLRNQPF